MKKLVSLLLALMMVLSSAAFVLADETAGSESEYAASYEVIIPADGIGDHPAFAILTGAQQALADIGIELRINDPADSNILWDALDAGTQNMWTAAWGATIDPDMYQVYHSSNVVGEPNSSESNHYHIRDAELDELIIKARQSDDQEYRKNVYKQCLDLIIDWAVELPTYQRQNCIIFSPQRIKMETVTPDITTFWGWMSEIEKLEMVEEGSPLVVAYEDFSQKFSPFTAETAYDQDVVSMTQLSLMVTDRTGAIVYNGIEGETIPYNGTDYTYNGPADLSVKYDEASNTTTYTAKLRDDLYFSDGVHVTADDLIFTYYTYLDPSYVGSTTLYSYDIQGLQDYRTQTTSEVYAKYAALCEAIFAAGDGGYVANDQYTEEQYNGYWDGIRSQWKSVCSAIVSYVKANYASYYDSYMGVGTLDENTETAFGMVMWGFAEGFNDAGLFVDALGNTYDFAAGQYPTIDDYYANTYAAYEGSVDAFAAVEAPNGEDPHSANDSAFILEFGSKDEAMGGNGVPNISGITKLDDYTVQVVVNGFDAAAVYSILAIPVTPLHYYGDVEKYDYENNKFGFDFGDISKTNEVGTVPVGAGAYKFVSYENKVVTFEANENYYAGAPLTKEIQFKETNAAEVASAVQTGTADAGEMTGSRARFDEVKSYNSNGEISGDVIVTSKVDNLGYGYLGINADTVNIGGEPGSEASKLFRKGFMTIFAVYRDVAIDSYYGEAASIINYPISNTSWAAPQVTDEGYHVAFSLDVNGNPIYTDDMTQEQKYEAAKQAALGYFEAAGCTVADGKVVAVPAA